MNDKESLEEALHTTPPTMLNRVDIDEGNGCHIDNERRQSLKVTKKLMTQVTNALKRCSKRLQGKVVCGHGGKCLVTL